MADLFDGLRRKYLLNGVRFSYPTPVIIPAGLSEIAAMTLDRLDPKSS